MTPRTTAVRLLVEFAAAFAAWLVPIHSNSAHAAVVVIANRLPTPVSLGVTVGGVEGGLLTIAAGESLPLFGPGGFAAELRGADGAALQPGGAVGLQPNAAYHVVAGPSGPRLRRLGLAGEAPSDPAPIVPHELGAHRGLADTRPQFVPVWVMVDEEQPTPPAQWRERLRQRVDEAGAILMRQSLVGLRVVAFGQWESDNAIRDFDASLTEFENEVQPPEGTLAIGFTSQYPAPTSTIRVGGTRGALRRHILLRDWSPNVSDKERVEMLVHELGHYLGAAHSPEATSVMRPTFGDRLALRKSFRIAFDPINALAIAMVGEEVRTRGITSLAEASPETRARLAAIYATLAEAIPDDPAAGSLRGALRLPPQFAAGAGLAGGLAPAGMGNNATAADGVAAIAEAALRNTKLLLPKPGETNPLSARFRASGDNLTTRLVRAAAERVSRRDDAAAALLVAIGVGLDDSETLRDNPRFAAAARNAEPGELRARRLAVLGEPTAQGRRDTLQHFALSAAITAIVGGDEALAWGLAKEAIDATRKSGYSFADVAADAAGVRFAEEVLNGRLPVAGLAERFRIEHFVPPLDGLPEGLPLERMTAEYGGIGDPRFDAVLEEIQKRIEALPPYAAARLRFDARDMRAD